MKKVIFISILIGLLICLIGCNLINSNENSPLELVAFNSLTEEEKDLIPVSPKDSSVEKMIVSDENKLYLDKGYDNDHVYSVIFNNTETDSLGKLTVFIDLDKKTVVGKGYTIK